MHAVNEKQKNQRSKTMPYRSILLPTIAFLIGMAIITRSPNASQEILPPVPAQSNDDNEQPEIKVLHPTKETKLSTIKLKTAV